MTHESAESAEAPHLRGENKGFKGYRRIVLQLAKQLNLPMLTVRGDHKILSGSDDDGSV